jgi:hypothetical protein
MYFLTKIIQSSILYALLNKYNFKFIFLENTIVNDTNRSHMDKYTNTTMSFWINTSILNRL